MNKEQIQEKLDEGGLLARGIVQIVGKPKEHIEKTLHEYIKQLKAETESGFTLLDEKFASAEKQDGSDNLFSAFCEVEFVCNDTNGLLNFCMDAMPSSVEIIEPENINLRAHDFTNLMNDFVTRMHNVDMVAKQAKQQYRLMSESLGIMVQNAVLILLNLGPKNADQIANIVGVDAEKLPRFLKKLVEDGKIAEKNGQYSLNPENKE